MPWDHYHSHYNKERYLMSYAMYHSKIKSCPNGIIVSYRTTIKRNVQYHCTSESCGIIINRFCYHNSSIMNDFITSFCGTVIHS